MKTTILICVTAFGFPCLFADTTNVIDIAALSACGTGTTNGWTMSGIDSYAGPTSVRVNSKEDYLISPDFDANIKSVIIKVKSSATSGRRLIIIPCVNGEYSVDLAIACTYSPNDNSYVPQSLDFRTAPRTTQFKIAMEDNGAKTAWGISYLAVVTSGVISPTKITVDKIHGTDVRVSWLESGVAASNLVAISKVSVTDTTFSIRDSYDFELCENSGTGGTQDRASDLHEKYPTFSGTKIYFPAQSSGILRISTGDEKGCLTHCGYPDYSGMAIEITGKRYSSDKNCKNISVYYLDSEQQVREIGAMDVNEEFSTERILLSGVPGGTAINIGNLDSSKTERRFLIDRIRFLSDYIPGATTTNIVQTAIITGASSCRIHGLSRSTEYFVTVSAIDASGSIAKPSDPTYFTTAEKDVGTLIRFR